MKLLTYFFPFAFLCLTACQNGKFAPTPQQEAAGIAALSTVVTDLANHQKPKDAAINAAQAALAAYAASAAAP